MASHVRCRHITRVLGGHFDFESRGIPGKIRDTVHPLQRFPIGQHVLPRRRQDAMSTHVRRTSRARKRRLRHFSGTHARRRVLRSQQVAQATSCSPLCDVSSRLSRVVLSLIHSLRAIDLLLLLLQGRR